MYNRSAVVALFVIAIVLTRANQAANLAATTHPSTTQASDEEKVVPVKRRGEIALKGDVRDPGPYSVATRRTIRDLILAAGAPEELEGAVVKVYPPDATTPTETIALDEILKGKRIREAAVERTTYFIRAKRAPSSQPSK